MTDPITSRVRRIERGEDPQCLGMFPSGYAILSNQQPEPITGCCMLLPRVPTGADTVPAGLHEMAERDRAAFLLDLSRLGDAVLAATDAEQVNYLILCNQVPALHGHVVPRFASEDPAKRLMDPFAAYDFPNARKADATTTDAELYARLRDAVGADAPPG
jgi:diadenosine tetraphosphate (Ap4A) HIT family hydrolase